MCMEKGDLFSDLTNKVKVEKDIFWSLDPSGVRPIEKSQEECEFQLLELTMDT
jgi:hypothetical protein